MPTQEEIYDDILDTVDECATCPRCEECDEDKLREYARAAVKALEITADTWLLMGRFYVAEVPLNGGAITYRVMSRGYGAICNRQ